MKLWRRVDWAAAFDFLYDENAADVQVKKTLRLYDMEPKRQQPRKAFAEEAIAALADSIRQYGMLQPILVRPYQGTYQIVAGERRWRAARMLGLDEVPVIIKEISDGEAMEIALIENLQRENLTPMEEANGYRQLMEQYGMTQEAVAKTVGRSRSAVANALRLLQLPEEIQMLLESGAISAGHGKALLAIANPEKQLEAAKRAANGTLTVRAIEKMAVSPDVEPPADPADQKIDSYFKEMELSLQERMGRRVSVQYGKKKGALVLEFYDKDDLAALARRLTE